MRFLREPRPMGVAEVYALPSANPSAAASLGEDVRGLTISDAAERYLTGRVDRGEITAASAKKIRFGIQQLIDAAGDKPVRKLSKADAEAWLGYTRSVGNIASTRQKRWSYLHCFCEWLVDEELLDRNPFRTVRPPKPPRQAPRTLSPSEVAKALNTVPSLRDRLILILMVQEGLRCEGVVSLKIEDIDFERRMFTVREKFGHERALPITDECWETLLEYLRLWPAESGPLIRAWKKNCWSSAGRPVASERGLQPATVSKFVSAWLYEAGVKRGPRDRVSAHAFRRTCGTDMIENGADLVEVRDTLGHTSVATTNAYLGEVAPSRLSAAMSGRRYGRPVVVEETA